MIEQEQRPATADNFRIRVEQPNQFEQVEDDATFETPMEGRQGLLGRPVVLLFSICLLVAVLAGLVWG